MARQGGDARSDDNLIEEGFERARALMGLNLTYALLDSLGHAIVAGHFDDRQFPTEANLAKLYSVSRSITREAVKMLTAKGLLVARPRKGTTVQPPSYWNLFDSDVLRWLLESRPSLELLCQLTELRMAIEPAAAALAASAGKDDDIAMIAAAWRRVEAAEAGGDDNREAVISFHLAVAQASGNPFFRQFRDMISMALQASVSLMERSQGRALSAPRLKAVLQGIERRAPKQARTAMETVLADVMDIIRTARESARPPKAE